MTRATRRAALLRRGFANSASSSSLSTLIVLVLAIPAAYALAIRPIPKWRDVLFFFISTKFLPIVASILPIWILARDLDLLNTRAVLIILYTASTCPWRSGCCARSSRRSRAS